MSARRSPYADLREALRAVTRELRELRLAVEASSREVAELSARFDAERAEEQGIAIAEERRS